MGWDFTHISGEIDRKAEVDKYFTWHNHTEESGEINSRVLKSRMVGSTYYGAIEYTSSKENLVYAAVVLTALDSREYCNFGMKVMEETMGPRQCHCPKAILDLLTETTSEWALEWRKTCRANLEKPSLAKLPIGTRIKFTFCGREYEAEKMEPNRQFKTAWFYCGDGHYMPKKHIRDFEIVA